MNHSFVFTISCILILFPQNTISAELSNNRQHNYYDDPHVCRGWYCYEDELQPSVNSNSRNNSNVSQANLLPQINWDEVWVMPPEKLKTLINESLSWAQQSPKDEQRMLTYLQLQGVAMRRAKQFQEAWSAALLKYPILDDTVQRSPTSVATSLEVVAERGDRQNILSMMREDIGILFFYSPTCTYCAKEQEILNSFTEKWNWHNITAINILERPDLVKTYSIQVVPDIWAVGNTASGIQKSRIKAGLADYGEIERGLINVWMQWFGHKVYERPTMVQSTQSFIDFLHETQVQAKDR